MPFHAASPPKPTNALFCARMGLSILLCLVIGAASAKADEISLFIVTGQSNARPAYAMGIESGLRASGRWDHVVVYNAQRSGAWLLLWINGIESGNYSGAQHYTHDLWASDGSSELQQLIAQYESEGHTVSIEGFFWFQGEGDSGAGAGYRAAYSDAFIWMIKSLRTHYGMFDLVVTLVDWNHELLGSLTAGGRTPESVDEIRSELASAAQTLGGAASDSRGRPRADLWHIADEDDPRGYYAPATDFGADQSRLMVEMNTCEGDFTGDGQIDFFDIAAFVKLLNQGCP